MRRAAMLLALVALGCPRHRPPPAPDFDSTPHLPSPTAGSYGRSYQDPPDEVVASLVGELR